MDVARRVGEPCDITVWSSDDALVIRAELVVSEETHTAGDEPIHGDIDLGHHEVEKVYEAGMWSALG